MSQLRTAGHPCLWRISLPEAEELAESLLERFLYRPSPRRRDFV